MRPDILLVEDNTDEVDLAMRVLAKELPRRKSTRLNSSHRL